MNKVLLELLSKMNGGNILPGQSDDITERNLFSEDVSLYIDTKDNKFYFIAEYNKTDDTDNYSLIEKATIYNHEAFGDVRINPSDAYLILFWKVDDIDESVYSDVIRIEEDEMFYKKYLIYYTDEELDALIEKLKDYDEVTLQTIIEDISNEEELANGWKLAIRIMTKIPFWPLVFPSAVMEDFEDKVEQYIYRAAKNIDVNAIMELKHYIDEGDCEVEKLVDGLLTNYLGDFFDGI